MNNIVLVGFMGSGKSTVGPLLASRLGRPFREIDDEVAAGAGKPVTEIFASEGEPGFRRREADCLQRALETEGQVVAVGGGAPLAEENWRRIRAGNCVVALTAQADELLRRLNGSIDRPLLKANPAASVAALLRSRIDRYLESDLVLATDGQPVERVVDELARRLPRGGLRRISIEIPGSRHEIVIGRGLGDLAGPALRRSGVGGMVVVATDPRVGTIHATSLTEALGRAGFAAETYSLPAGERAKSVEAFEALVERLGELRLDRSGALVALGGGTVGDVTGFAAATLLRGIRYLHIPTTLLAMVDSSIGGKTAINLRAGKNLVGALHQPVGVLCDLAYLDTLPEEEFRSGMAEVCKAAMIADADFARWLLDCVEGILRRDVDAVGEAVARAVSIKASVVRDDPTEVGRRAILNYGHTVGHGLERALGYGRIRHGEAVAWGMQVAAELGIITGRCPADVATSQRSLLEAFGLLRQPPRVDRRSLLEAIAHDKKSRGGEVQWVLLRGVGNAEWGCRVGAEQVDRALNQLLPG